MSERRRLAWTRCEFVRVPRSTRDRTAETDITDDRTALGHRRFRPDIEGLRAVAVLLVIAYHAQLTAFGGGYVGVDVFFVISGFLITGLLFAELEHTGQVGLTAFYARRARRLLPAAGLVLLCTLVAATWLLPAFRLPSVAGDATAAALYVSNIRFGIQANDYFQLVAPPSPVLHYWSLSVEEQFYIVWPAILLLAYRWPRWVGTPRRRATAALAILAAASIVAALVLTQVNQPWAFFLLPTRAWELAVGGVLYLALARLERLPSRVAGASVIVGLACVIAAALAFDDGTPFPGTAAILPVAGAGLVIAGGSVVRAPLASRGLSIGPLRFVGRISYSLYLWHWPILLFGTQLLGPSATPILVLVAIAAATATQRLVEEPFRRGRFVGIVPRRNLLQAAGVAIAVIATSVWLSRPVASVAQTASGPDDAIGAVATGLGPCQGCTMADLIPAVGNPRDGRADGCAITDMADPSKCVLGSTAQGAPAIVVFGDSHAQSWVPAIQQSSRWGSWRIVNLTYGGCPSVMVTVWSWSLKRVNTECEAWRDAALARLAAERPAVVLLANSWGYALFTGSDRVDPHQNDLPALWLQVWSKGMDETLARLNNGHVVIGVIGDTPDLTYGGTDPLTCVADHPNDLGQCAGSRSGSVPSQVNDLVRAVTVARGNVYVDPTNWLCGPSDCPTVIGTYLVYSDGYGHVTAPFVSTLAGRLTAAIPAGAP